METTTIRGGFFFNQKEYKIIGDITPQTETQVHIDTDKGTILLDLDVEIDGVQYDTLDKFILALTK